jgi:hypothetical protein
MRALKAQERLTSTVEEGLKKSIKCVALNSNNQNIYIKPT